MATEGEAYAKKQQKAQKALETLGSVWLGGSPYIAGAAAPSIADLLAYEEVVQMLPAYLNLLTFEPPPAVAAWVERMQTLPHHDEAHAALAALGDLTMPSDKPMDKRLGAATKAGMQAIAKAQPGS